MNIIILASAASLLYGGGAGEAAGSDIAGAAAADGRILKASEIQISSYISQLNYDYPLPEKDLGITLLCNYKEMAANKKTLIQVGIQGKKTAFKDLPPFNLCFLFDVSGSMAAPNKILAAARALKTASSTLRPVDTVSIRINNEPGELLSPVPLTSAVIQQINSIANSLYAEGNNGIENSLEQAFKSLEKSFIKNGTNRVILFSDGKFNKEHCLDLAEKYRRQGITLSTIGVGSDFESELMTDMARLGGGSSRFISSDEQITRHFRDELDRMLVPVAFDLDMELSFLQNTRDIETWGYDNVITGTNIHFSLPSLHNGDYETILAKAEIPPPEKNGIYEAAVFSLSYTNVDNKRIEMEPVAVLLQKSSEQGYSRQNYDYRILQSSLMLTFAENLISIGRMNEQLEAHKNYRNGLHYHSLSDNENIRRAEFPEIKKHDENREIFYRMHYEQMIDLVLETYALLGSTELQLGKQLFKQERQILDSYIYIILARLRKRMNDAELYKSGSYIRDAVSMVPLEKALTVVVQSVATDLPASSSIFFPGIIFAGTSLSSDKKYNLNSNELVRNLLEQDNITVLDILPDTMPEDYIENATAVIAGRAVSGDYILLLIVNEASTGRRLYARLIDVDSGKIIKSDRTEIK